MLTHTIRTLGTNSGPCAFSPNLSQRKRISEFRASLRPYSSPIRRIDSKGRGCPSNSLARKRLICTLDRVFTSDAALPAGPARHASASREHSVDRLVSYSGMTNGMPLLYSHPSQSTFFNSGLSLKYSSKDCLKLSVVIDWFLNFAKYALIKGLNTSENYTIDLEW